MIAGALLVLSALFCALIFFSFNPYDSSWLYYSSVQLPTTNLFGSFGAQIAAFFFYAFGISAWCFVGILLYGAYILFFKVSFAKEWDRLVALLFLPTACSALFHFYNYDLFKGVAPGGVVGAFVHRITFGWFEGVGSAFFLHLFCAMLLMIIFRATFVKLLYILSRAVRFLLSWEKCLRPAYKVSKKIVHVLAIPFVAGARFVRRLFGGVDLLESNQSVVSFEELLVDLVEENDVEELHDDPFWQQYAQGESSKASPKIKKEKNKRQFAHQSVQEEFFVNENVSEERKYTLPGQDLFKKKDGDDDDGHMMTELEKRAKILEEKLERFGVYGSVISIKRGPVVTLFEYQPQIDSKISKIISLEDDLALALQAMSIRIIAPIPGKSVVGFEVANLKRKDVLLSSIVRSQSFEDFKGSIPLVLGKNTVGKDVLVDLAKMPHLLIAGSTGSGKSVALNAFLVSMLCKLTPDQLKLVLIDPKRLEFASYADIPHLLFPIVTNPKRVAPILRWVVEQMEERYEKMSEVGARNIFEYNDYVASKGKKQFCPAQQVGEGAPETCHERLPFVVIVIDELSDLMMTAGRDIEDLIARIAQMARAAGIHMIVATQRPSVDVITGLIKVNFPSRISFRVTSKVDSRTILDYCGAEKLLGCGDMLFIDSGSSTLGRLHGAYVSNQEIEALVNHIRAERAVEYLDISPDLMGNKEHLSVQDDSLYQNVIEFLNTVDEVSISLLQRKFRIGYNRSARIMDMLEARGAVMPSEGSKMRKVVR